MTLRFVRSTIRDDHRPTFSRQARGFRLWGRGRRVRLYAVSAVCSCGWLQPLPYADKREAKRLHAAHFSEAAQRIMDESDRMYSR